MKLAWKTLQDFIKDIGIALISMGPSKKVLQEALK